MLGEQEYRTMQLRHAHRRLTVVLAVLASACASTALEHSWSKPDIGQLTFTKVAAVAVSRDASRRRMMEDAMVQEIQHVGKDVQAVPSYSVMPDQIDTETSRRAFEQRGFDGVVALRVTDVSRSDVYVPGSAVVAPVPYRTFWGYYNYWVPIAYEPGYVEQNSNVRVETEVYSLANGSSELIYSAVSQTLNPTSTTELVNSVASVVSHDLRDKGLLK
jgi:hypothetical protein